MGAWKCQDCWTWAMDKEDVVHIHNGMLLLLLLLSCFSRVRLCAIP